MSNFNTVFKDLSLSQSIKNLLSDTDVTTVKVLPHDKKLEFNLTSDKILYNSQISELKNQLIRQFKGIADVDIKVKYVFKGELSYSNILNSYWDNVVYVSNNSPICTTILKEAKWELDGNKLFIDVRKNSSYYLKLKHIDKKIQSKLKNELDFSSEIIFREEELNDEQVHEYESMIERREEELIHKAIENIKNNTKVEIVQSSEEALASTTPILYGKNINAHISKIVECKTQNENVVIEGKIFALDVRETKNGDKYIVSFDITDFTDSTTVKFFPKKDKFIKDIKSRLKIGMYLKVQGNLQFDTFSKSLNILAKDINIVETPPMKKDSAEVKRVELHLHTQMSNMDAMTNVKDLVKRAAQWGHKAIAITDHGVVQSFPEAASAGKANNIKIIYGMEAYLVDNLGAVVQSSKSQSLDSEYVVFDIETTGLSSSQDKIIEIGAVKVSGNKIVDTYSTFVNPEVQLSEKITKLTSITDDMLVDAPKIDSVLPEFLNFVGNSVLVAHNANFDVGFIRQNASDMNIEVKNTVLDTLELSRTLFPQLSKHKLDVVAKHLDVSLENHHRAVDDAGATAEIFIKCVDILEQKGLTNIDEINILASESIDVKKLKTHHAIMLAKSQKGLRNLYELISKSNIEYFFKRPRIPKSEFIKYREGILLGSACEAGEVYRAIIEKKPDDYIDDLVNFYDYLEIQPLGNNQFLLDNGTVESVEELQNINKRIIDLADKHNKLTVATCDVHFMDASDEVYRRIIMAGEGFKDADNQPPLYFRNTDEMLNEFMYLGKERAEEVVIKNTNIIADMIEEVLPVPNMKCPPHIEGSEEELRKITYEKAISIYGDPLPRVVKERLDKELNSIISNGYAVLYIIAQKLVWKSNEDGYLVGSRGSVGSSFAATMAGITEVNPLSPHYICPNCKYSDFDSEVVKSFAGDSGYDMPDAVCPKCGTKLKKEGHDIPFETFLGFEGDKEPDIDLNFSGEYQQRAHAYTEELFGKGHVFKAGTYGTMAEKTAYGFVKKYFDERGIENVHNAEINRLALGCTGVRRTTGQHPGGLVIVPSDHDIHEFCPIQRPANDMKSNVTTTHFEYHSIDKCLLKLDLLGHDDPTIIRMLQDLTGVDPKSISLDDKKVMSLFTSTNALDVKPEDINSDVGTLGLPEFGTKFVRQMLVDTQPHSFSELIRISGLSHGTDVWVGNAQDIIKDGTATLKEAICTRDDIMVYLILQNLDKKLAFKIMEKVRKGKGLEDSDVEAMKAVGVPDWYIKSCKKIKYMFPKAHAAAYVMMAYRIAYFKVYYPQAYYATYFSIRAEGDFDYMMMCKGQAKVKAAIKEYEAKGNSLTTKEKGTLTILEVINEMHVRGINFVPIDLYKSSAKRFLLTDKGILPPFIAIQGMGDIAAESIVEARKDGEFFTIEDFKLRTKVGATMVGWMKDMGIFEGIPETSQLSLF